jgi:PST family polysaccharide transporter
MGAQASSADPPPSDNSNRRRLDRTLVSGVTWVAVAKSATQVISWCSMLVLARLLSPTDFALLGLTTVYLGLINVLSVSGIDSAVIAMPELRPGIARQLNTLSILMGLVGSLGAALVAGAAAAFFRTPELTVVISVMGLAFVATGFGIVPRALLVREFQFKTLSILDSTQVLIQALSAVVMAWLGMRYWALVWSGLAGSVWAGSLLVALRGCGFARPKPGDMKRELTLSWQVLVARLSWYCYSNADFVVAGRVLEKNAYGLYSMAWQIAIIPVEKITSLIAAVTPPLFSKVQEQPAELRRYIRALTEGLALVTFPVGIGLALVAGPLVRTAFDRRWWGSAGPLTLLCVYAVIKSIDELMPQILKVLRGAGFVMWIQLLALILFPPSFYYASRWGGTGIAAVWLIMYPLFSAPLLWRVCVKTGMRLGEYAQALKPASAASAVMIALVFAAKYLIGGSAPSAVALAIQAAVGALAYSAVLVLFYRDRLGALARLVFRRGMAEPLPAVPGEIEAGPGIA